MCGICGYRSEKEVNLEGMTNVLSHRGPDDSGFYCSGTIGLGHRRLSIIDISGGHQPMVSEDGRVVIVFNGEIYNFQELREILISKGFSFNTSSDTEVLLKMYILYGKDMLQYLNGMFAFVIYDTRDDKLFGARDRLGIKPLYYAYNENGFFFASEIKSLFETGLIKPRGNPSAVDMYFTYRYIPGRFTIYRDIYKVLPAYAFEQIGKRPPSFWQYWDFPEEGRHNDLLTSLKEFNGVLTNAVKYQLISDVPLGVFLSGGVDSTTIAAIMSKLGHQPIRAFTVGFNMDFDETSEAQMSAEYYNCEHYITYVTPDSFNLLPKIIWHMDEPFGDPILIPTYVLSLNASKQVKVVLTGEGADEGQMGYIHQENLSAGLPLGKIFSSGLLSLISRFIYYVPVSLLDAAFNYPRSMGLAGKERLSMLFTALTSPGKAYQLFVSLFTELERDRLYGPLLKSGKKEAAEEFYNPLIKRIEQSDNPLREIYIHDFKHWLSDNILNKQDRMTMANSVEARVPFLDHRVVEFVTGLPQNLKIRRGRGKFLLRELFNRQYSVPGRQLKKKQPFFMSPEGHFAKAYKELIDLYLTNSKIDDRLFNVGEVADIIKNANNSPLLGHKKVMALILFQIWQEVFRPEWN